MLQMLQTKGAIYFTQDAGIVQVQSCKTGKRGPLYPNRIKKRYEYPPECDILHFQISKENHLYVLSVHV